MAEHDLAIAILSTDLAVTAMVGIHRPCCLLAALVRSKGTVSKGGSEASQTKSSESHLGGWIARYRSDD